MERSLHQRMSIDYYSDLPPISIPYLQQLKHAKVSEIVEEREPHQRAGTPSSENPPNATPSKSRRIRNDSLDDPEADPWASPALHKGHTHVVNNDATPKSNGTTAAKLIGDRQTGPSRTTSTFTTHSEEPGSTLSTLAADTLSGEVPSGNSGGGWGSYDNPNSGFPNSDQSGLGASGFGSGGDESGNPGSRISRSLGGGKSTNRGVEETVTITVLPEKEGMFMFQHRNYEVKSARRASTVVRRYSDFVWLLDCLHKRYPFRQLPLLPPKRVAGMTHF